MMIRKRDDNMLNTFKLEDYGDVLSPKDVHDILGIGFNKTYSLLKTGEIKNFKVGRDRKIPKRCLIEYIDRMISCGD